jgi:mono/diheme cytochrome c family protein
MRAMVLLLAAGCSSGWPEAGTQTTPEGTTPPAGFVPSGPLPPNPIVDQAVPLVGGGIAAGLEWVGASDPDDDGVELVRIANGYVQRIDLDRGSAPTAVAWTTTSPELLHVILRGNSSLLVVEPAGDGNDPQIRSISAMCDTPRGLGWDEPRQRMWIACASGELVAATPEGERIGSFRLDGDLRDVVVLADGRAFVSRMRQGDVIAVDLDTGVYDVVWTPGWRTSTVGGALHNLGRGPVRRLVPAGPFGALALFQWDDESVIEVGVPTGSADVPPPQYYASSPVVTPCEGGIVTTGVAHLWSDGATEIPYLLDTTGNWPVDLVSRDLELPVVATATAVYSDFTYSAEDLANGSDLCLSGTGGARTVGSPTAATLVGDRVWMATREPFTVGPAAGATAGTVDGTRSGLAAFHDAPAGIACASCHVDGGDDGHLWVFSTGARRTQSLGGIEITDTAPFHWNGDLATFDSLLDTIGVQGMGLRPFTAGETADLKDFLDALPRPAVVGTTSGDAEVARGAVLFADSTVGCADCHAGWRYTNGLSADVGTGGTFQVPSLVGVGARVPLMHDGCANTLRERFDWLTCGGWEHGSTEQLSTEDIDALVAFLETL